MNIIAFLGSPRENGNTELLLKEIVKGVQSSGPEVKTFMLNRMNIQPCQNCGGCEETGECIIDDDMPEIYLDIRKADRIILASPIFFFGLSAQTKAMIDRCQSFWCGKYLLERPVPEGIYGRKGLLLLVGAMEREIGVTCSDATAKAFFRTINVQEHSTLSFLGIDAKGAVKAHPIAMNDAFEAGRILAGG